MARRRNLARLLSGLALPLLAAIATACAGRSAGRELQALNPVVCSATPRLFWESENGAPRRLVVSLDAALGTRGRWAGRADTRFRDALARWNTLGLPVRLAKASSPRERPHIRVHVVDRLPLEPSDRSNQYRAGVTHLTYGESGALSGATIVIAERTLGGTPYSTADQEATLLHELGHALGLPHSDDATALMAPRPVVSGLTHADASMARANYWRVPCGGPIAITTARRQ